MAKILRCRIVNYWANSKVKNCLKIIKKSHFSYKLRIECMLLKEEWASTAGYLESAINAILVAGDDLMSSRAIQV